MKGMIGFIKRLVCRRRKDLVYKSLRELMEKIELLEDEDRRHFAMIYFAEALRNIAFTYKVLRLPVDELRELAVLLKINLEL